MRIILLICFLLTTHFSSIAQNQKDSIEVRTGGGTVFLQNGIRMNARDLLRITKSNKVAYKEMKSAKMNKDMSALLSFSGAMITSYSIGWLIGGGEHNWAVTGTGIGLLALSMPFNASYNKRATNAVRIYNDGIRNSSPNKVYFNLGITPTGMGVCMTF
jgi:hypothetical protein